MKSRRLAIGARYLLGIAMAFFGLNGFFQFVTPPTLVGGAADFLNAIVGTGYLFELTNIIFIAAAIMLLTNRYVPLALVIIFPVMVNVVFFHIFLDFVSGIAGYVVFVLNVYLIGIYWDNFKMLLEK